MRPAKACARRPDFDVETLGRRGQANHAVVGVAARGEVEPLPRLAARRQVSRVTGGPQQHDLSGGLAEVADLGRARISAPRSNC